MKYDVLLFTRGLEKNEDYHWCSCPEYINRKELYNYLLPLIDHIKSSIKEIKKVWKEQYVFLNREDCSFCVRLYESEYDDFCGRKIFVIEGIACSSIDRNFMFNDLVNVALYFSKSQESLQDIYYNRGGCKCLEIPGFINPKAIGDDRKPEFYADLVKFIRHQGKVSNVFIGSLDSLTSFLFKNYQFANIDSVCEVDYQCVKEKTEEKINYDVKMEVKMGKKWLAEYSLKACDIGNNATYVRIQDTIFDSKIKYANLYAENNLLVRIMNVLWG